MKRLLLTLLAILIAMWVIGAIGLTVEWIVRSAA